MAQTKIMTNQKGNRLLDFFKRSLTILKITSDIINNFNLNDKKIELELKEYVNSLIEQFLKFNIEELKTLMRSLYEEAVKLESE